MDKQYLLEVTHIKALTLNIFEVSFSLIMPAEISFTEGQGVELQTENVKHLVFITSVSTEGDHHFTTCFDTSLDQHLKHLTDNLEIGSQVKCSGPVAGFAPIRSNQPLLAIAQNIGVTPLTSFLPTLMIAEPNRPEVKLVFEVENEEQVFYFNRFTQLARRYSNFKFLPILAHPHAHWPGEVGSVAIYMHTSAELFRKHQMIICGNANFVAEILKILEVKKFDKDQIQTQIVE